MEPADGFSGVLRVRAQLQVSLEAEPPRVPYSVEVAVVRRTLLRRPDRQLMVHLTATCFRRLRTVVEVGVQKTGHSSSLRLLSSFSYRLERSRLAGGNFPRSRQSTSRHRCRQGDHVQARTTSSSEPTLAPEFPRPIQTPERSSLEKFLVLAPTRSWSCTLTAKRPNLLQFRVTSG